MLRLYMKKVTYKIIEYVAFIQGYILYGPRKQIQGKTIIHWLLPPKFNFAEGLSLKGNSGYNTKTGAFRFTVTTKKHSSRSLILILISNRFMPIVYATSCNWWSNLRPEANRKMLIPFTLLLSWLYSNPFAQGITSEPGHPFMF